MFIWIVASVADTVAVSAHSIKAVLDNGLSTFFIKGKPFLSNGPKSLPKNAPGCPISCYWVFDNF